MQRRILGKGFCGRMLPGAPEEGQEGQGKGRARGPSCGAGGSGGDGPGQGTEGEGQSKSLRQAGALLPLLGALLLGGLSKDLPSLRPKHQNPNLSINSPRPCFGWARSTRRDRPFNLEQGKQPGSGLQVPRIVGEFGVLSPKVFT